MFRQSFAFPFRFKRRIVGGHKPAKVFLRQQFRYGRGARVLHRRRVSRGAKYRFELRYFYVGLFMAPFRSMRARPAARTAALLVMAQICNVLGFLYQRET